MIVVSACRGRVMLIILFKVKVKEVFFQEDFKLILSEVRLLRVFSVKGKQTSVIDCFDLLNGLDWDSHQGAVAAA